jgi:alcohol dehydrogenase, propanol-preferring
MQAMQISSPDKIENSPFHLNEVPLPEPGPGQALMRVSVCGVCHTDLHVAEGDIHPPHYPVTPGHQAVGQVVRLGKDTTGLMIGQRVGLSWLNWACGECEFCQRGEENLCPRARFTGFNVDGGFAEYALVEARTVLPIPDELSDQQAAPLLCAGIIGYRSLRKANLHAGERLGLYGFGASAHIAIQIARYWNCQVYVITRSAHHQQHGLSLGAVWAGSADEKLPQVLDRAVIFAPVGELVPAALQALRPGGSLAINAIAMTPIPSLPYDLIYGERSVCSVANATYQDGCELMKLASIIPLRSTIQEYPFHELNRALQDLKASRFDGEAVLQIGTH